MPGTAIRVADRRRKPAVCWNVKAETGENKISRTMDRKIPTHCIRTESTLVLENGWMRPGDFGGDLVRGVSINLNGESA
jgi:hypothetical protein